MRGSGWEDEVCVERGWWERVDEVVGSVRGGREEVDGEVVCWVLTFMISEGAPSARISACDGVGDLDGGSCNCDLEDFCVSRYHAGVPGNPRAARTVGEGISCRYRHPCLVKSHRPIFTQ